MKSIYGVKTAPYEAQHPVFFCESYSDALTLSAEINKWKLENIDSDKAPSDFIEVKYLIEEGDRNVD